MTVAESILLVEDEVALAAIIADNLAFEGYAVEHVTDGLAALDRIRAASPSLVLLDVMLPSLDGYSVCERLRGEGNEVPVLFITACTDSADRIRGLALGGDDYLAKPFELDELILRVRAVLRRARGRPVPPPLEWIRLGDAEVDLAGGHARVGERAVPLSEREVAILRCLAERPGEVVSRADVIARVWRGEPFGPSRNLDNFILRLRRVLEPDPRHPRFLHTIFGEGFRLTP